MHRPAVDVHVGTEHAWVSRDFHRPMVRMTSFRRARICSLDMVLASLSSAWKNSVSVADSVGTCTRSRLTPGLACSSPAFSGKHLQQCEAKIADQHEGAADAFQGQIVNKGLVRLVAMQAQQMQLC